MVNCFKRILRNSTKPLFRKVYAKLEIKRQKVQVQLETIAHALESDKKDRPSTLV